MKRFSKILCLLLAWQWLTGCLDTSSRVDQEPVPEKGYRGLFKFDPTSASYRIVTGTLSTCINEDTHHQVPKEYCANIEAPVKYLCYTGEPIQDTPCTLKAQSISTGGANTCTIGLNGSATCWLGSSGLLGGYFSYNIKYAQIDSGTVQTCGITDLGILKCWGYNRYGAIGNGTTNNSFDPVEIDNGSALSGSLYSQISTGAAHTCGITTGNVLKCWGLNDPFGQLGIGAMENFPNQPKASSLAPAIVDTDVSYTQVSAGDYHTCGITFDKTLKCWGSNSVGKLGKGTTLSDSSNWLPVIIDPNFLYDQISAGGNHTCGITVDKKLKCWGYNDSGQLGSGNTTNSLSPLIIDSKDSYSQVSAGYDHTCGITAAGVLKCWGSNSFGQLGDGTASNSLTPKIIDSGTTYSKISVGEHYTCGIASGGFVKCWGRNNKGQLGDGSTNDHRTPIFLPL